MSQIREKCLLALGVVFVAMLAGAFLVWSSLQKKILIPQNTVLTIVVTPRTAQKMLTDDLRQHLPTIWQTALASSSRIPVVLGIFQNNNQWHAFVLAPRWKLPLLTLATDDALPKTQKNFRYTDALLQWWKHPLSQLMATVDMGPLTQTTSSEITLHKTNDRFLTNLALGSMSDSLPATSADVSVDAFPDTSSSLPLLSLLESLHLGVWLGNGPITQPSQINIELDKQGKPAATSIVFSEPLGKTQLEAFISGLGVTRHRAIQLADGTVVNEQLVWRTEGTTTTPILVETDTNKRILILDHEVQIGDYQKLSTIQEKCGDRRIIAHLSQRAALNILNSLEIPPIFTTDVSVSSDGKNAIFCFR